MWNTFVRACLSCPWFLFRTYSNLIGSSLSVSPTPFIASPFKTLLFLYLESLTFVYFPANLSSDSDEVCDPWCQQYWGTVSKLTKDNFQNSVSYQPLSLVQQVDFYSSLVFWHFNFYIQKSIRFFSTFWSVQWLCYYLAVRRGKS